MQGLGFTALRVAGLGLKGFMGLRPYGVLCMGRILNSRIPLGFLHCDYYSIPVSGCHIEARSIHYHVFNSRAPYQDSTTTIYICIYIL